MATFFNLYYQNNRLIVTGSGAVNSKELFAVGCKPSDLNLSAKKLTCNLKKRTFGFGNGMVVVRRNNFMIINKDVRSFDHYVLDSDTHWEDSTFGTKVLKKLTNVHLDFIPDAQPRNIVGDKYGMVINWDNYAYDGDQADTFASYNTTAVDALPLTDTTHLDKSYIFTLGQRFVGYMVGINLGDEGTFFLDYTNLTSQGKGSFDV